MARTEETNQRIREAQREKILDAARKVFARKGVAATMDDVAAEAAVSHGLPYRYFASKEAIFQALIDRMMVAMQNLLDAPGTPGERLALLISRVVKGRYEQREFFQLVYQMFNDEVLREQIRDRSQIFVSVLRQLIVEGQASGEVAAGDPDELITMVLACLDGLTRLALRNPERFNQNTSYAEILMRLFKP